MAALSGKQVAAGARTLPQRALVPAGVTAHIK